MMCHFMVWLQNAHTIFCTLGSAIQYRSTVWHYLNWPTCMLTVRSMYQGNWVSLPVLLPQCFCMSLYISLFLLSACIQMTSHTSSTRKRNEGSHCSVRLQHCYVETEGWVLRSYHNTHGGIERQMGHYLPWFFALTRRVFVGKKRHSPLASTEPRVAFFVGMWQPRILENEWMWIGHYVHVCVLKTCLCCNVLCFYGHFV